MTADEVRQLYGSPQRIARQILHRRFQEMWTYAQPSPLYVEFSAATGQEPRIVTVHSFSSTHK
jgi:predicted N-formylglutamate amidohydrolase